MNGGTTPQLPMADVLPVPHGAESGPYALRGAGQVAPPAIPPPRSPGHGAVCSGRRNSGRTGRYSMPKLLIFCG